jgi:TonB-dependent SusC/RagA subfamily outer membrane receptor
MSRTTAATLSLLAAFVAPLHAQATDSIALDSAQQRLAPITIGLRAPVRSIGSTRRSLDSSDMRGGARPRTLSELLQARLPGVSVLRYGGDPSDGSRIRLRGTTSLVGDAAPVVVIDGIPVNTPELLGSTISLTPASRFDDFDPEEIEQVDVLSGPAATTLFGGGASNGAVLITTKRGVAGRPRWRAWSQGALSNEPTTYPANYRQNGTNPSTGSAASRCDVIAIADQQCNPTTLDAWNPLESASPFRQGRYGAGGASVAGGPFGIKAYTSALGRAETSVLDDSWASRVNGRLNAERELFGRLTIGGSVGYVNRRATTRIDHVVLRGVLGTAVDDENRGYRAPPTTVPTTDRRGDRLSRSARAEWRLLSWLRVHVTAGRDEVTQRDLIAFPALTAGDPPVRFTTRYWQASSIVHGTAEAQHQPNASVALRTLVSYEESSRRTAEEQFDIGLGGSTLASGSWRWSSIRSWMVQERISVADRLFLNLGARRIAGERSGNRGRWHPAVDLAWDLGRLADDATLRLRGAYAVGVQPRDTINPFSIIIIPSPFEPAVPIEPEEPREGEVGFDARWGTRLDLNATLFAQETPKLIAFGPGSPSSGFGTSRVILGKMQNRGVELAARVRMVDRPATRWTAAMTVATLRNRVRGLGAVAPTVFTGAGVRNEQPFGVLLTRPFTFVDANGDNLPSQSEITATDDLRPNGSVIPTREASLRSELGLQRWGLVLSAALDHRGGHRAYNMLDYHQCFFRTCRAWQDPSVSLAEKVNAVASSVVERGWLYQEAASYTRLGEVALEWTPARFGRAIWNGVTISVEARNLVTWTPFEGPDPEVATTSSARQGLQGGLRMLPALPRTIGLRVEFAGR